MVDHARARRLSERIKVLAAEALERVVKDPDLMFWGRRAKAHVF